MAYLIDANVFIEAKNRYYGFDICPAFWDWLIAANADGTLFSVEKVGDEIRAGDDRLAEWAAERGEGFFVAPPAALLAAAARIDGWTAAQGYAPAAAARFAHSADHYLVAHALEGEHAVVTLETASGSKRRIKIPNVCAGFGIGCLTPFEMLRREGARFVLGASV